MGWLAKDIPTLIFMLLPGFLAASIFYTLTSHPKASEFERVIQALIFTAILKVFAYFIRVALLFLGRHVGTIGPWTSDTELTWSVILAAPLGLFFVYLANTDAFHHFVREWGLSSRTSYPSEWYGAFVRERRWVILHLATEYIGPGVRRLYGWPEEWPDQPDKGHFVIDQPEWLLDTNERAPLYRVDKLMVPAADVKMVEFLKANEEVTQDPAELERAEKLLLEAQKKERDDGGESPAASTEPAQ